MRMEAELIIFILLSQYNVALMHVVNHAFFKALLFLGAGIKVPAINPAIFWKLLYRIELKTGQSEGNLIYKLLGILRGHTQEVIIIMIILFILDSNNNILLIQCSSVFLISHLNYSFQEESNKSIIEREVTINKHFNSYLAGLFEGDGCV